MKIVIINKVSIEKNIIWLQVTPAQEMTDNKDCVQKSQTALLLNQMKSLGKSIYVNQPVVVGCMSYAVNLISIP